MLTVEVQSNEERAPHCAALLVENLSDSVQVSSGVVDVTPLWCAALVIASTSSLLSNSRVPELLHWHGT